MFLDTDILKFKYKIITVNNTSFQDAQLGHLEGLLNDGWSILTQTILPSETIVYILVHIK